MIIFWYMSIVNNYNMISLITWSVSMDPKDSVIMRLACKMRLACILIYLKTYKIILGPSLIFKVIALCE